MKINFLFIITLLSFLISCQKENTETNNLSGKLKRSYYYDSLNVLRETTDYLYDASGSLYMFKSNLRRIILFKSGDTLMVSINQLDTITQDTISNTQYAYLNTLGYIDKIEYLDSIQNRQFERQYITNASGILQSVLLDPTGNETKLFDFVYNNGNYISHKLYNHFFLTFPPYSEIKDTLLFNYSYTTLSSSLLPNGVSTSLLDTYFNLFGYKNSVSNTQLLKSYYAVNLLDTISFTYLQNSSNQIIEYKNYKNNRIEGRHVFEYY